MLEYLYKLLPELNWGTYSFQDEASDVMLGIRDLHDNILFYLIFITIFVSYLLIYASSSKNIHKSLDLNHNSLLEFIWTVSPAIILILIAIPSLKLLYFIDEVINPIITVKINGHQWYWSYNIYDAYNYNVSFTSYMEEDYKLFKYLEVDNSLYLPILVPIRLIVTSTDVMHSWAVPSLGIKLDAIPGRINQGLLYILKEGIFFGQCSELCGMNHAYMPIEVIGVNNAQFIYWLKNNE